MTLPSSSSSRSKVGVLDMKIPINDVDDDCGPEWKRVLLADGPRQSINALTLYSFWVAYGRGNPFNKITTYYDGNYITAILLMTMIFTVLIFIGSLLLLLVAAIFYVPLLCYIRGNLKVSHNLSAPLRFGN